jgi:hypothetical protein
VTGKQLPAVKVEIFDEQGHSLAGPTATNDQGEFAVSFQRSPSANRERTGWKLVLTAEAVERETIDVGKVKEPNNANETVYLIFLASMRKAQ